MNQINTAFLDMQIVHKDAEMLVLGSYLKVPALVEETTILADYFYFPEHQRIMNALLSLSEKRNPIDVISVIEEVGFRNLHEIGGQTKLSELMNSVISTESIHYHEKLLKTYYQKRKVVEIVERIKDGVIHGSSDEFADVVEANISHLIKLGEDDSDDDTGEVQDDLVELYDEFESTTGELTGIPTGFQELDHMTSGLQDGDLVIVGARPSMGKTAFCLNIAQNVTEPNCIKGEDEALCIIFSLEMPKKQLLKRFIAQMGNIDAVRLRSPMHMFSENDWDKLTITMGILHKRGIRIFDKAGVTLQQIWRKVRKLRQQHKEKKIVVVIDYLQLILGNPDHKGNRQQEISEISRSLKLMAREFKVNVIALSQLSRSVEQRQDKHPMMSDLRESGSIEQDADVIAFLYRDDYYDKETENKNIIEIILAKQRNGPIGTVRLAFIKEYGKFVNLERSFDDSLIPPSA